MHISKYNLRTRSHNVFGTGNLLIKAHQFKFHSLFIFPFKNNAVVIYSQDILTTFCHQLVVSALLHFSMPEVVLEAV